MSGAPEYKYTDRDVREDDTLVSLAYAYLRAYGGEYEPLVQRKLRLADQGHLSILDIRIVLNCMRHDCNVSGDMPRPQHSEVTPIAPRQRKTRRQREEEWERHCGKQEFHDSHTWIAKDDEENHWCIGTPWPIMRGVFTVDAKIKAPFAVAQSRRMVHRPSGVGLVRWYPNAHAWGWDSHVDGPDVEAKMACKTHLRRPILLMEIPDNSSPLTAMPLCRGCFPPDHPERNQ